MKRLLLLTGGFIVVLIILLIFTFVGKKPSPGSITPTPASNRFKLTSSIPKDGASSTDTNVEIRLQFNQRVTSNDVEIFLWPEQEHDVRYEDISIIISPRSLLAGGTPYRVSIFYSYTEVPTVITFTTKGTRTIPLPDTGPDDEAVKRVEEEERIERPDIFLKNNTPYSEEKFSISGDFSESTSQFVFTVTGSREAATAWMKSLGLDDSQIQNLKITYTSP